MNTYREQWQAWQRSVLIQALTEASGNQCRAAESLGVHRNTMSRMCELQGIKPDEYRKARTSSDKPTIQPRFRRNQSEMVGRAEFRAQLRERDGAEAGAEFLNYPPCGVLPEGGVERRRA